MCAVSLLQLPFAFQRIICGTMPLHTTIKFCFYLFLSPNSSNMARKGFHILNGLKKSIFRRYIIYILPLHKIFIAFFCHNLTIQFQRPIPKSNSRVQIPSLKSNLDCDKVESISSLAIFYVWWQCWNIIFSLVTCLSLPCLMVCNFLTSNITFSIKRLVIQLSMNGNWLRKDFQYCWSCC